MAPLIIWWSSKQNSQWRWWHRADDHNGDGTTDESMIRQYWRCLVDLDATYTEKRWAMNRIFVKCFARIYPVHRLYGLAKFLWQFFLHYKDISTTLWTSVPLDLSLNMIVLRSQVQWRISHYKSLKVTHIALNVTKLIWKQQWCINCGDHTPPSTALHPKYSKLHRIDQRPPHTSVWMSSNPEGGIVFLSRIRFTVLSTNNWPPFPISVSTRLT